MTRPPLWSRGPTLAVAALLLLPSVPALAQDAAEKADAAALAQDAAEDVPDAAAPAATAPTVPTATTGPSLEMVVAEQTSADQDAGSAQIRVNELDDETQKLLADYRTAVGQTESFKAYTEKLQAQVDSQHQDIASIERQLAEVETTAREVLPLTEKMLATLKQFVELDVPFLIDERRNRIAKLE